MEEREERKAGGILKTSKKGVKKTKAFSAEEEERRREAVKEALREKLELEKRALQIVERLLEDSVAEDFLVDCARFITRANYNDTVEERSIAKLCGYPICPNKLGKIPTQRYKISTKTNKVYDITERKLYCSNFCYKASKQFELQISKTPLWLRNHESPSEITLMKKGDSGSSGEEVQLSEQRVQEEDVENPSSSQTDPSPRAALPQDSPDRSDDEQDFVSSVVSKKTGPRVHWGDLPEQHKGEKTKTQNEDVKREENGKETALDKATAQLQSCSFSSQAKNNIKLDNSSVEIKQEDILSENKDNSLNITQVGMSKRGAQGLRHLLKKHGNKPDSVRSKLLERLEKTLREWSTAETMLFLYGAERPMGKKQSAEQEELDEDDIEEDGDGLGEMEPSGAAPDYETLKREAQEMQLKVREFYRGSWTTEEEERSTPASSEKLLKEPVLPLVDSKAQRVIQKKITVDKLSGCLKNIVGSLGLTMNDITTDLNNLVRTFRFTNTNIIHKTPAWTLLAVLLLHLLSEVSPLIRQSLQQDSSVQYLHTLMEELQLRQEDLLGLVDTFRPQTD